MHIGIEKDKTCLYHFQMEDGVSGIVGLIAHEPVEMVPVPGKESACIDSLEVQDKGAQENILFMNIATRMLVRVRTNYMYY